MLNRVAEGDMVIHTSIKGAIGVLLESKLLSSIRLWQIYWIAHPTEQLSITLVSEKWIRKFRGYRKTKK